MPSIGPFANAYPNMGMVWPERPNVKPFSGKGAPGHSSWAFVCMCIYVKCFDSSMFRSCLVMVNTDVVVILLWKCISSSLVCYACSCPVSSSWSAHLWVRVRGPFAIDRSRGRLQHSVGFFHVRVVIDLALFELLDAGVIWHNKERPAVVSPLGVVT